MKKYTDTNLNLIWFACALSLAFVLLWITFGANMFSGTLKIQQNDATLTLPKAPTLVLVLLFVTFIVLSVGILLHGQPTVFSMKTSIIIGIVFICFAAIFNIVMIVFSLATATYRSTVLGNILLPDIMSISVITVLFFAKLIVIMMLRSTVYKKK